MKTFLAMLFTTLATIHWYFVLSFARLIEFDRQVLDGRAGLISDEDKDGVYMLTISPLIAHDTPLSRLNYVEFVSIEAAQFAFENAYEETYPEERCAEDVSCAPVLASKRPSQPFSPWRVFGPVCLLLFIVIFYKLFLSHPDPVIFVPTKQLAFPSCPVPVKPI